MAKVDPNWEIPQFPESLKKRLDALLEETKPVRDMLDKLDRDIQTTDTVEGFKNIAKLAVGNGNYIRKKLKAIAAIMKNTESKKYLQIKYKCAKKGDDFVHNSVSTEAIGYAGPLRLVRSILEGYVESSDNLISICRMHTNNQQPIRYITDIESEGGIGEENFKE